MAVTGGYRQFHGGWVCLHTFAASFSAWSGEVKRYRRAVILFLLNTLNNGKYASTCSRWQITHPDLIKMDGCDGANHQESAEKFCS